MSRTKQTAVPTRGWRYRVTEVTGSMVGRLAVGEMIIEWADKGPAHTWRIVNTRTGHETGAFAGERLDEVVVHNGRIVGDG